LAGDHAGYRDLCAKIVEENPQSPETIAASLLSRVFTLAPDAMSDWTTPMNLARQAVEKQPRVAWNLYALGIAQHRAGQHEDAVQSLQKSLDVDPDWLGRSQNHAVLALAWRRLGRDAQAQQSLENAHAALREADRTMATSKFGYAASDYLSDSVKVGSFGGEMHGDPIGWLGGYGRLRRARSRRPGVAAITRVKSVRPRGA
jgi:tetratricopeptide (TPR) repeat protein